MNCFISKDRSDIAAETVYVTGLPRNREQSSFALSPVDHSAILPCINPKAFWFPSPGLSALTLRASLGLVLRDYPVLAGRIIKAAGGRSASSLRAMRRGLTVRISVNNAGGMDRLIGSDVRVGHLK